MLSSAQISTNLLDSLKVESADLDRCAYQAPWSALKNLADFRPGFKEVIAMPMVVRHSRPIWAPTNRRYDLPWLIQNFSKNDCADPRDKIYGLLAIVKSFQQIKIDYSLDTANVFVYTATSLLLSTFQTFTPSVDQQKKQLQRWFSIVVNLHATMLPDFAFGTEELRDLKVHFKARWHADLLMLRSTQQVDVQKSTVRSAICEIFRLSPMT